MDETSRLSYLEKQRINEAQRIVRTAPDWMTFEDIEDTPVFKTLMDEIKKED